MITQCNKASFNTFLLSQLPYVACNAFRLVFYIILTQRKQLTHHL
jgi:hypothetical protein